MKIAVWHNLPSGGGKRALYYHIKLLTERGHKVEVWCPPTADRSPWMSSLSEFAVEHVVPLEWQVLSSSRPLLAAKNFLKRMKAMDKHCRICAEQINANDFDIFFANACAFYRTSPIGRYVEIPKVIYLGEPYRWLYEALPQLPWVALDPPRTLKESITYIPRFLADLGKVQLLRIQMREEIRNARAFDRILVNSLFSRESVLRAYGLDAKVCYLGVDTELFSPTGAAKENFVVGLGAVYFGKGIERAIEAVATIHESKRPFIMWLGNLSDGGYQKSMEDLARTLNVKITFIVGSSHEQLLDILSRASALVYTSRLEPFGLAPLEANACGTPVVAIAEGGIRETVKDGVNGFLVNDDDPRKLGDAILRILEDRTLLSGMSAKCRDHVIRDWTWAAAIDRLEKNLLDILQARRN